jgi:pimeloyl-ACP methyl ester carboxylesterase/membrane protein DedA with SNARE-associated domain
MPRSSTSQSAVPTPTLNPKIGSPGKHLWRWRILEVLGSVYMVALAASYYERWEYQKHPVPLSAGMRAVTVSAIDGDRAIPGGVRIAYREAPGQNPTDPIPVVLIHGSPGSSEALERLMLQLQGPRRLIAPDLPGFGASSSDLPDYSFRAHAAYVWEMLDRLGIQRVHLVGFSMGGGVVLNMAQIAPDRVASLTMLSAINVQEMELLGDYHLNHAVHGAQLAGLWVLKVGLPRFGWLNQGDMGVAYARNFYDSDQRPLRGILRTYNGPMLILHGQDDPLVPVEAALEAHRLVPQSELDLFPNNHFMVFMDPRPLVPFLSNFLDEVESGRAVIRATAPPERVAAASQPMDTRHWPKPGFVTLVVMLLSLALATFLSEDLACITAGVLVAEGRMNLLPAVLACFVGIFVGDMLLFLVGRWVGRPAIASAPLRWLIRPGALEDASGWLSRNGAATIFASRFVPGTRLPTYLAAGVLHTSARRLVAYFLLAAAIWTPLVVGISAGLGLPFLHSGFLARQPLSIKLVIGGAVLFLLTRLGVTLATYRGRRGLARRWKRLVRWEFWPPYVFYPPVVIYVLYLGLRSRGLTLFAAANPAIPASGFVGESKSDILEHLKGAGDWLPRWTLLPAEEASERIAKAEEFLRASGLELPVVLKPDAGQRGSGVAVIRSSDQLCEYLSHAAFSVILQEYVPGREFGVFYYRRPDHARGRVFSVTEKRMPVLVGDGKRTLEELILADDRAVCMSTFYLHKNSERAKQVPPAGEHVQLVEIGTHCRGAIFLDGSETITSALEEVIDRIAKTFPGFFFGRFDIRVPSVEDFSRGLNLKVVELNGVTSEATHIYDPKLGLWEAYRVLFEQWRIAFEIGDRNRALGTRPTTVRELIAMIRQYRQQSREYPD